MKRKLLTLMLPLLLFLTFVTPAFAQEPEGAQFIFGDNFTLEAEKTLDRDLVVFGGNVTLKKSSTLTGDLVVFGGNVEVAGTIEGDIGMIGGNISLDETAVVEGDIGLLGGHPNIATGAVVRGEIKNVNNFSYDYEDYELEEGEIEPAVPATPRAPSAPPAPPVPERPERPERPEHRYEHDWGDHDRGGFSSLVGRIVGDIFGTTAGLIVLGLITWVVAAFMPEQMYNVRRTITDSPPMSFGAGLITVLVAGVVGLILFITICLAFVPIIGYLLLGIATLFGWIVIGQIIGERLLAASGRSSQPGFIFSSIVGVSLLTLLTSMPVIGVIPCLGDLLSLIGAIIGIALALTGLGAVLLTRFGTRPYQGSDYPFSGGGPSSFSTGSRVRWTDPAPEVSPEEVPASEAELRAKIRAALAEADQAAEEPAEEKPKKRPPQDPADDEPVAEA